MKGRVTVLAAAIVSLAGLVKARALPQPAPNFFGASHQEAGATSPGPVIDHAPICCIEASVFPEVGAAITSLSSIQRSRVYFKAHQYPDWYYVEMAAAKVPKFLALLPRPRPDTQRVDYYVFALDSRLQISQTTEYSPQVAKGKCQGVKAAGTATVPQIRLHATREGQPSIPPGFDKAGIVAFVTVAGLTTSGTALAGRGGAGTVAAGAGGAAGGGGIGAGTVAAIGAGLAAAGVGVAVAAKGGGNGSASNQPPSVQMSLLPTGQMIVSVTEVRLSAVGSDPDGDAISYDWSFGDGQVAAGPAVTHVYSTEGTFQVSVTARDSRGASVTASTQVTVRSLTGAWTATTSANSPFTGTQTGSALTLTDGTFGYHCRIASPRSLTDCMATVGDRTCASGGDGTVGETLNRIDLNFPPFLSVPGCYARPAVFTR